MAEDNRRNLNVEVDPKLLKDLKGYSAEFYVRTTDGIDQYETSKPFEKLVIALETASADGNLSGIVKAGDTLREALKKQDGEYAVEALGDKGKVQDLEQQLNDFTSPQKKEFLGVNVPKMPGITFSVVDGPTSRAGGFSQVGELKQLLDEQTKAALKDISYERDAEADGVSYSTTKKPLEKAVNGMETALKTGDSDKIQSSAEFLLEKVKNNKQAVVAEIGDDKAAKIEASLNAVSSGVAITAGPKAGRPVQQR